MRKKIYVWDPVVRIFHWSLALAFVTSYLSGEEESTLHVYSGYLILGLIGIRIIWGLVGPKNARFSDFIYRPSEAMRYLKGLLQGETKNYLGHNPAAGWMVIALLISLLLTGLSGLKVYGLEGHGPLAANPASEMSVNYSIHTVSYDEHEEEGDEHEAEEEFWEEIHEFLANLTVFLVVFHIIGVVLSSLRHKQNLAKSMLTGYKYQ